MQVLALAVIFLLLALGAGVIDVIYLAGDRRQAQWIADAAARAAVKQVGEVGTSAARDAAFRVINRNQRPVGGSFTGEQVDLDLGRWDTTHGFVPARRRPDSIQVTIRRRIQPLMGRVLGLAPYGYEVAAVATIPSKDVMFVLDISGSMEFDTPYRDKVYRRLPAPGSDLVHSPSGYYYLPYGQYQHPSLGIFYGQSRWYYLPDGPVNHLGRDYTGYWMWRWRYQTYRVANSPLEPIHSMKVGAVQFAEKLDLEHVDRAGVVAFNGYAELRQELTDNLGVVRQKIMELGPGGGTNIARGIRAAVDHLNAASTPSRFRQKIIVLTSDGCSSRYSAEREAARARDNNVLIFTVSIGRSTDRRLMQSVARRARGREYYADSADELSAVFKEVFEHLPSVLTD